MSPFTNKDSEINEYYEIFSHMDENRLNAFIDQADVDNRKLLSTLRTNTRLIELAQLRLINLAIEQAEVK